MAKQDYNFAPVNESNIDTTIRETRYFTGQYFALHRHALFKLFNFKSAKHAIICWTERTNAYILTSILQDIFNGIVCNRIIVHV